MVFFAPLPFHHFQPFYFTLHKRRFIISNKRLYELKASQPEQRSFMYKHEVLSMLDSASSDSSWSVDSTLDIAIPIDLVLFIYINYAHLDSQTRERLAIPQSVLAELKTPSAILSALRNHLATKVLFRFPFYTCSL